MDIEPMPEGGYKILCRREGSYHNKQFLKQDNLLAESKLEPMQTVGFVSNYASHCVGWGVLVIIRCVEWPDRSHPDDLEQSAVARRS